MAQDPYRGRSGLYAAHAAQVSTVSAKVPSDAEKADPVTVVRTQQTTRRPCLSKGGIIAIAVVVALLCLGGIAVALIFTVFRSAVWGSDTSTTQTTPTSASPLPIWQASTTRPSPLPAQCGRSAVPPIQTKIAGGIEATQHSWPWLVILLVYSKRYPSRLAGSCGGALIADQWIITAAHCTTSISNGAGGYIRDEDVQIDIQLGVHYKDEYEVHMWVDTSSIFRHEQYSNTSIRNDIALLKLPWKVAFDDLIQPICVPKSGEFVSPGSNYYVAGWGSAREDQGPLNVLMQTQLPVTWDDVCTIYPNFYRDSQICAGWTQGQNAPCTGDSGASLMMQRSDGSWVAVGLVSYADGCAIAGKPDVFTDVSYFRPWMDQVLS